MRVSNTVQRCEGKQGIRQYHNKRTARTMQTKTRTRTRNGNHNQKTREASSPTTSDLSRASTSPGLTACLSFANITLAEDDECTRVSSSSSGIVSRLSSERKAGTEGRLAWMARRPWNRSDPTSTEAEKEGVIDDLECVLVTSQSIKGTKTYDSVSGPELMRASMSLMQRLLRENGDGSERRVLEATLRRRGESSETEYKP
jgi:hypothetical protein